MPIYMDRHDVSDNVTAEIVAQIHQEDLKIQHQFGCRGLTYWFDDVRKTAFCLVEAPNKEAIVKMHDLAHGEVPHQVIEVDASIVESFLGRIEDPEKAQNTKLNVINDPAFRVIMVVSVVNYSFQSIEPGSFKSGIRQLNKQMNTILKSFDGKIVQQTEYGFLISFQSVTKAVSGALKILENYKAFKGEYQINTIELKVGLHAGVPVTEKASIFEDTIKLAERMGRISKTEITVSSEIKDLYQSENAGFILDRNLIRVLTREEVAFLSRLMEFMEKEWQNTRLKVKDFEGELGVSKSKLYREMIQLTGKSPNTFLLYYRLEKSLKQLQNQEQNISEIAFDSGFNSPSYFSKCFRKEYGVEPSKASAFFNS